MLIVLMPPHARRELFCQGAYVLHFAEYTGKNEDVFVNLSPRYFPHISFF